MSLPSRDRKGDIWTVNVLVGWGNTVSSAGVC